MCGLPVTFGGGTAIEKFSSWVPLGVRVEDARLLPAREHAGFHLGGLVEGALLECLETIVGHRAASLSTHGPPSPASTFTVERPFFGRR